MAEILGLNDALKVSFHERNHGALNRHIGSRSHCNTDVAFGQGRSIVDAIAGYGYNFTRMLQFLNFLKLVFWQQTSLEVSQVEFCRYGLSGIGVVTSEHDHVDSPVLQFPDRLGTGGFNLVTDHHVTLHLTIYRQKRNRFSQFLIRIGFRLHF